MLRTMLAALAPAVLVAAPASAAPDPSAPVDVIVNFADLDLARPDHQNELARRIAAAARVACERPFIPNLMWVDDFDRCVTNATESAHRDLAARPGLAGIELAAR